MIVRYYLNDGFYSDNTVGNSLLSDIRKKL